MGQDGPRGAKRGQQQAETEQILDVRGTGQSRVADFGGGNQVRLNGPCPPPSKVTSDSAEPDPPLPPAGALSELQRVCK